MVPSGTPVVKGGKADERGRDSHDRVFHMSLGVGEAVAVLATPCSKKNGEACPDCMVADPGGKPVGALGSQWESLGGRKGGGWARGPKNRAVGREALVPAAPHAGGNAKSSTQLSEKEEILRSPPKSVCRAHP